MDSPGPLACFLGFCMLGATGLGKADDTKPKQRTDVPIPRVIEYPWMTLEKWRQLHQEDIERLGSGPIDVLFLGDSITQCWDTRGLEIWEREFEPLNAANFGVGGDTTQNLLWRITEGGAFEGISPKVFVVMIGTNNIGLHNDTPEDVARGVKAILDVILTRFPHGEVLLMSVFPRGRTPADSFRVKVVETNKVLKELESLDRVTWFPLFGEFLSGGGILYRDVMNDYLHPNAKGYAIWARAIKPEIERLMAGSVSAAP